MPGIDSLHGLAAPLMRDNIDTDVIIASRDITAPSRQGLGPRAFAAWRYNASDGAENPEFILNQAPWREAKILIAGRNFGCGSSREMAVWALQQLGIGCVIAPSFGSIFRNNCVRNGLLPLQLPDLQVQQLADKAQSGKLWLLINLHQRTIELQGMGLPPTSLSFELDPQDQQALVSGLDAVDRAWEHRQAIEAFEARDRLERPWAQALRVSAAPPSSAD